MRRQVFTFIAIVLFISFGVPSIAEGTNPTDNLLIDLPIIFWGDGCPHCAKLKTAIKEQSLDKLVPIKYLEIYNSKENQTLFYEAIALCNLDENNAGVPILYYNNECAMGSDQALDMIIDLSNQSFPSSYFDLVAENDDQEAEVLASSDSSLQSKFDSNQIILISFIIILGGGAAVIALAIHNQQNSNR